MAWAISRALYSIRSTVFRGGRILLSSIAIDGRDGEALLIDFSDEATLLPAQNSAFATPDSSALIFKADGVSAPLFAVPLDGSAPAAQLGSEDQLSPAFETLTDTHLIVSYADGGSTLAELNLADGSLLDRKLEFPGAVP